MKMNSQSPDNMLQITTIITRVHINKKSLNNKSNLPTQTNTYSQHVCLCLQS